MKELGVVIRPLNSYEGLEHCEEINFDFIFGDVFIPRINGLIKSDDSIPIFIILHINWYAHPILI